MPEAGDRLATLAIEDFTSCVGQTFRLVDAPFVLSLERADMLTACSRGPGRATPFSLVFIGPHEPILPQQIHRLEHEVLGAIEIFLVPIGRDAQGVRYESVFS